MKKKIRSSHLKNKEPKLTVIIQNYAKIPETPTKKQFQQWAEAALVTDSTSMEITIRIVTPEESADLNKKFRQKSGPTNILSFAYSAAPGENIPLGDLVICAELVQQDAQEENKTLTEKWAHLTVHGLLHLQGYDHEIPAEAEKMEALEIQILHQLGFSNPYEDTHETI